MAKNEDELKLDSAPSGGSNKKTIIMIAGGAVVLVVITVVVMLLMLGGGDKKAEAEVAKTPDLSTLPVQYYSFKPDFVISFLVNGRQRFLQLSLEIAQRNPVVADTLKMHDPMIRSEINRIVASHSFDALRTHEGRVALQNDLKQQLAETVKRESGGAEGIEAVLFTNFVMQ